MQIAVVGSINTDITIKVPRFSRRNETVVGVGDYTISHGGKGANQAAAAAASGAKVYMIGKVGSDDFGARALENLQGLGVNCDFVDRTPDHATGLATILVDDNGDNSITVAPGANGQVTEEDICKAKPAFERSQIIMLQLEIPLHAVNAAIHLAKDCDALVLLDPAPAPSRRLECLVDVDYITPNEIEAEAMTGISMELPDGPMKAAETLLQSGVKNVALTLGARGSFIANDHYKEHMTPYAVTAVDSTGAGDVFSGFLAASLAKGKSFRDSACVASAAAALSVTRPGARSQLPNWQEVEEFLQTQGGRS